MIKISDPQRKMANIPQFSAQTFFFFLLWTLTKKLFKTIRNIFLEIQLRFHLHLTQSLLETILHLRIVWPILQSSTTKQKLLQLPQILLLLYPWQDPLSFLPSLLLSGLILEVGIACISLWRQENTRVVDSQFSILQRGTTSVLSLCDMLSPSPANDLYWKGTGSELPPCLIYEPLGMQLKMRVYAVTEKSSWPRPTRPGLGSY